MVHGLNVQVRTDEARFVQLIEQYYSTFYFEQTLSDVNITIDFNRNLSWDEKEIVKKAKRYGEGIYLNTNTLFWKNEFGFRCKLKIIDRNHWIIQGFHYDILRTPNETEILKNMIRSMRWLMHFPIFEMLNRCFSVNLLHASAVSLNSKTFVFAGLNKVGKSSLARFFYERLNYYYLSDNFLLHDEKLIYSFPEKVRLSETAIEFYGLSQLEASDVYGKKQIMVPIDRVLEKVELQRIFYINNGEDLSVKPLTFQEYDKMITSAHRYLKEFSEYEYLSFLDLYSDVIGERKRCVRAENCLYYELTLPLNWEMKDVIERIQKCL